MKLSALLTQGFFVGVLALPESEVLAQGFLQSVTVLPGSVQSLSVGLQNFGFRVGGDAEELAGQRVLLELVSDLEAADENAVNALLQVDSAILSGIDSRLDSPPELTIEGVDRSVVGPDSNYRMLPYFPGLVPTSDATPVIDALNNLTGSVGGEIGLGFVFEYSF